MASALVNIVGTTTNVRDSAGMPLDKSMRGNGCGATNSVASQFVSVTANWLTETSNRMPVNATTQSASPERCACTVRPPVMSSVTSIIVPRYGTIGNCLPALRSASKVETRLSSAPSSSGNPLSIR